MTSKKLALTLALIALVLIVGIVPMMALNTAENPVTGFKSAFYTPGQTLLFSYQNGTYFTIKNSADNLVWNGTLQEAETKQLTLTEGVYFAFASKPYTLLAGDAQNQTVVGYYALDMYGKATSTKLYTYIPKRDSLYSLSSFIIFSYSNTNRIKVTDAQNKSVMWQGTLNDGQHFSQDLTNTTWQNKTVAIESTYPVSALCYLDQGYLVPSSTGLFTGNLFYTYSGNITNGNNDLNVIGYQNLTQVTISNSVTKTAIWSGTLNEGEVHSQVLNTSTYITVSSNQSVAVSVDPYPSWSIMYQAALYAADVKGGLIGNQFFTTARGGGYLRIVPNENDTKITVVNQATNAIVWTGQLGEMSTYKLTTTHTIYNITTDKPVAVLQGYGEWSGLFTPLYFTADSEAPTISDITRTPQNPISTQTVQVSAVIVDRVWGVQNATLSYSTGNAWTNVSMALSNGNTYQATIPAMPQETKVDYKITAYDNLNNMGASGNQSYVVGSITTPTPTTTSTPTPTASPSPTPSPTSSPTAKPTNEPEPTSTPTATSTPTSEPSETATPQQTSTTEPDQLQGQSLNLYMFVVAIFFLITCVAILVARKRQKLTNGS